MREVIIVLMVVVMGIWYWRVRRKVVVLEEEVVRLRVENGVMEGKVRVMEVGELKMREVFRGVSLEVMEEERKRVEEVARREMEVGRERVEGVVKPVREALEKFEKRVGEMEAARVGAYEGVREAIRGMMEAQGKMEREAGVLGRALRSPNVRGQWGEMQLRRAVELAGMVKYVDFFEQESSECGGYRPDMIVRLPNGRQVVVDAKAPLGAYLESLEAVDEVGRMEKMREYGKRVREHMVKLGGKGYWKQFEGTVEFVVMYLPGEAFFSAALEVDGELVDRGVREQVILATPTTLIGLLKAVGYGWKQEAVAKEAAEIGEMGKVLYERVGTLAEHFGKMKVGLERAVEAYNGSVRCMEARVLPVARKFRELNSTGGKEIEVMEEVGVVPVEGRSEEMILT